MALFRWLEHASRDLRIAVRMFSRTPGFTAAAVVTLALGIGADAAMFSVVYGVLLRPLPYRDAGRLALVQREQDLAGARRPVRMTFFSATETKDWVERSHAFESTALYSTDFAALAGRQGTELVDTAVVSESFFAVMNGPFVAGRPPSAGDDTPSVVISDALARRLFVQPSAAVGRPLTLSSQPYTIAGVASSDFQFPSPQTDAWIPAALVRAQNPRCCGFQLIGRLKSDQTITSAAVEADALARSVATTAGAAARVRATVVGLHDAIAGAIRPALLVLFTAVGLALLVACANVTNLLLARHATRARETATRWALGASRGRLVAHSVIEGAVLAGAGTVGGLSLAAAIVAGLRRLDSGIVPMLSAVRVDLTVVAFAAVLASVVAVATSLLPAWQLTHVADALRSGPNVRTRRARYTRHAICVAEVAVSLVLLVGATLLGRSLVRLMQSDLGVTSDHVLTASINLAFQNRLTDAQALDRVQRIVERLRAVPGIQAAGVGTSLPPNVSRIRLTLRQPGESVDYQASGVAATPDYFRALGMRLVQGRWFNESDDRDHTPVMIMSVDTARRFFGNADPIGRTLTLPVLRDGRNAQETMTLVGVVASVKYSGLDAAPDDAVYRPFAQQTWVAPFVVTRTTGDPVQLVETLRREIAAVDLAIVVSDVKPLETIVSEAAAPPRLRSLVLMSIAGLALALSAVGLYGVVAYSVSQRATEIGIRRALGANEADVLGMVLREGSWLAAAGIVLGVGVSLAVTRTLTGFLYGTAPTEPASLAIASAGLLVVMLIASYIPARRAAKMAPSTALRCE